MFCVSLWYRVRLTYTLSKAVKSITAQLSWDGDWCHASKDAIHPLFTPLACCSESCFPRGGHKEVWESNQALVYCLRQHDPLHTPLHVLPSFQLRRAVYTCVCMDHLWYRHVADTLVLGVFARSRRYNHWTSSTMDFCCLSISMKSYDFWLGQKCSQHGTLAKYMFGIRWMTDSLLINNTQSSLTRRQGRQKKR